MDFFQAQTQAHKRTKWLIVLFAASVAATIMVTYLAVAFLARESGFHLPAAMAPDDAEFSPGSLWNPLLLAWVAGGTLLLVGGAALFKTAQLHSGGRAVAEMVGGRQVNPATTDLKEKRLLNVVEEMSIASGIPVPDVYVLDDEEGINAFAAGLTTSDAVVTVTHGTLDKLNRDELQGVIGHEFSHILNGDMRLNLRLVSVVFGIFFLTIIGRGLLRSLRFAGGGKNKKDGRLVLVLVALGLAFLVVGYIGYFFGRLIQAAVSRQREFLADASSVQFTRNPAGITGALKKIGGYSLGSHISSPHASAISHFFFAESLSSNLFGLLATHPPLDVRIRAVDPQFDGKYFEPPTTIDIAKESFASAGLVSPPPPKAANASSAFLPAGALASIGTLSLDQVENAQGLIGEIPARLREAARLPSEAPALVFALLLSEDPAVRTRQLASLPPASANLASTLAEPTASINERLRLPLCQLALPSLRSLSDSDLADFFATLKQLADADGRTTVFEFALQKVLLRQLVLSHAPKLSLGAQVYSFQAMKEPIVVVLSAMAHASSDNQPEAAKAYAAGLAHLKSLDDAPALLEPGACGPALLDPALDRLAIAAGPIKQRLLLACAQIAGADGKILVSEAELLRAIAACLDCPMPPLA